MINHLSFKGCKATCTIWHESTSLGGTNFRAQVGLIRFAVHAIPLHAHGGVARNHQIANLVFSDAFANTLNYCCSLMTNNARELALRIAPVKCLDISVAKRVRNDSYSDLSRLWWGNKNLHMFQTLFWCESN